MENIEKNCIKNLVSIITPSFNNEKHIQQTIDSVLVQTYEKWELLIIDDSSADSTYDIALTNSKKDERIKVFQNDKNMGAAYSRNKAIEKAQGEFIAFLDADDLWYPEKLCKQVDFMKKNNYNFTYTNFSEIDSNNIDLRVIVSGPNIVTQRKLFRSNYIGCLTVMYNQERIGKISISNDIKKRNDHALWMKIIKKENCYLLNEVLSVYRKNNGLSNSSLLKMLKHHYNLYKISENKSSFVSCFYVFENLLFGYLRKKKYTKIQS